MPEQLLITHRLVLLLPAPVVELVHQVDLAL
jgi:hypothetical protein